MTRTHLERRHPARNMQRYYTFTLTRTLFGQWAVIREWGRIGHPGTVREAWFATEDEAVEAVMQMRGQKERRGYRALR